MPNVAITNSAYSSNRFSYLEHSFPMRNIKSHSLYWMHLLEFKLSNDFSRSPFNRLTAHSLATLEHEIHSRRLCPVSHTQNEDEDFDCRFHFICVLVSLTLWCVCVCASTAAVPGSRQTKMSLNWLPPVEGELVQRVGQSLVSFRHLSKCIAECKSLLLLCVCVTAA